MSLVANAVTDNPRSPEMTLLRTVCGGSSFDGSIAEAVEAVNDWREVARLTGAHALGAFLSECLNRQEFPRIPEFFLRDLRDTRRRNALNFEIRERALKEIQALMGPAPDRVRELKGGYLARWAYEDPRLRNVGDLDVLVRSDDVRQADEAIRSLGYRRLWPKQDLGDRTLALIRESCRTIEYSGKTGYPSLDLHWRWTTNPHILRFDAERTWDRGEPDFHIEMFLFLVVHGGRHAWCRLSWLNDIHRLVLLDSDGALDWPMVHRRAADRNTLTWLSLAFAMCEAMFGTPSPIPDLPPPPRRLLQECMLALAGGAPKAMAPISWSALIRELRGCDTWTEKTRVLGFAVFSPSGKDIVAVALPRGWEFGYRILRPFLWLRRRLFG